MPVLTDQELQDTLKVSRQTLWRLRKGADLPFFKVGGQYRYRSEDIDRWLSATRYKDKQLQLVLPPPAGEPARVRQPKKQVNRKGKSRS